jgi:RNA polymerase sigma-70 factor (ECF subfamily)
VDVADALRRLSPNEREVMQLVVWDGLSVAETAEVLGCSVNVVQVRLHRARKRLVRWLRATGDPSDGVVATVVPAAEVAGLPLDMENPT